MYLCGSIQQVFFTHDIFRLNARAVKRIRGCVADLILAVVNSKVFFLLAHQIMCLATFSLTISEQKWIFTKIVLQYW